MKAPHLDRIVEAQAVMDPVDGAVYDATFTDAYWWGLPDTANNTPNNLIASKQGRNLLTALQRYNDGMLRLGDPEAIDTDIVDAKDVEPGTILKLTVERLFRKNRAADYQGRPLYTSSHTADGYAVMRFRGESMALYAQQIMWHVAAETSQQERAFFPVMVRAEASYGAGLSGDYNAAIKVAGTDTRHGTQQIELGRTRTRPMGTAIYYERVRRAAMYRPIVADEHNAYELAANGFRPKF